MNANDLKVKKREAEASLIVVTVMQQLGISSGEIPFAKASQVYGAWFRGHVKDGTLTPVRYGGGTGRIIRYFSISRILSLKAAEYEALSQIMSTR